ncbi:2-oxoacid:acceptor oxidoreductase family protein [candidate division WOR-3 bacterium]|nr:2-oxoacid:acceptor oxidoreductase family protein [candidate division WOR-3 bacterium]
MEKEIIEIRWHGRGGQGAKTAALLFGEAALETGMYIQAFPEYGPERTGAPVSSYNRLSKKPIRIHSGIETPDIVLVLDPTLIGKVDVTAGLKENGVIIVNTKKSPSEMRKMLGVKDTIKVYTVDAYGIALDTIGKAIPNTPMLGSLIKATGILNFDHLLESVRKKLEVKFRGKGADIVDKNIQAIKKAYEETKGEE